MRRRHNNGCWRCRLHKTAPNRRHKPAGSPRDTSAMMINWPSLKSLILATLLATALILCSMQPNPGAQALKLPSIFSWMQPQSQPQQSSIQQQQQASSSALSLSDNGLSKQVSAGAQLAKPQPENLDEPMLASASSAGLFEAANSLGRPQQQQATGGQPTSSGSSSSSSALRKPFQLMLPGKHNHLFSALPKSLFGRLLMGAGQSSGGGILGQPPKPPLAAPNWPHQAAGNFAHFIAPGPPVSPLQASGGANAPTRGHFARAPPGTSAQQVNRYQFRYRQPSQVAPVLGQQQQQHGKEQLGQAMMGQPVNENEQEQEEKKHALGLGESDEFMLVEPAQASNQEPAQEHPYALQQAMLAQQQAEMNAHQEHSMEAHSGHTEMDEQSHQEHYQEMPALMVGEQEAAEMQQQQQESSTRVQAEGAPEQAFGANQKGADETQQQREQEQQASNSSAPLAESSPAPDGQSAANESTLTTTTISPTTISESVVTLESGNQMESQPTAGKQQQRQTSGDLVALDQNATAVPATEAPSSGGLGQQSAAVSNESSILSTLISDELTKLKQEPEALNETFASISKPLVALFLDSAGLGSQSMGRLSGENGTRGRELVARPAVSRPGENFESGGLESSAAAIIASPGEARQVHKAGLEEQLAALGDDQIESFILGPYKGLTSDTGLPLLAEQQQQQPHHQLPAGQFRARPLLPQASDGLHKAHTMGSMLATFQHVQHPHPNSQAQAQSLVGVGMSSMASNLIQQAKSLIQLPFVHLTSNQANNNNNPMGQFRGQQHSASAGLSPSRLREPLMDQSSSPSVSFRQQQQLQAVNNYQTHSQPRPFYKQQQSVWPPVVNHMASLKQHHPRQHQVANGGGLKALPVQAPFNQQSGAEAAAGNFLRPAIMQQHHPLVAHHLASAQMQRLPYEHKRLAAKHPQLIGHQQQVAGAHASRAQPSQLSVPYFVEAPPAGAGQRQPVNREQQHLHGPLGQLHFLSQQQLQDAQSGDNSFNLYTPLASPKGAKKGHPLNDIANQRAPQQQQQPQVNEFRFVVSHGNKNENGAQQQQQPQQQQQQQARPVYFAEPIQQQQVADSVRQMETAARPATESARGAKFKSGLYQIEPPKLNKLDESASQEQQQQQLVGVPDADEGEPIQQQQQQEQQLSAADQQVQQSKHEPDNDAEDDDEEQASEQQAASEQQLGANNSVEASEPLGQEFARQVGATIGVANNRTHKGQVFSEPISLASPEHLASRPPGELGRNLTQVKRLKFSQDVTLYDFEVPSGNSMATLAEAAETSPQLQQQQRAQFQPSLVGQGHSGGQQQQPGGAPSGQPISFLDTQVYTIPYTLTVQPDGRPRLQQSGSGGYGGAAYQSAPRLAYEPSSAYGQVARFPLPYLAPPGPQVAFASVAPQAAPSSNEQPVRFVGGPARAQTGAQEYRGPVFSSLFQQQDFAGAPASGAAQRAEWMRPQVGAVVEQQEQRAAGNGQRQHYFHYQPVATLEAPNNYRPVVEQQATVEQQSREQQQARQPVTEPIGFEQPLEQPQQPPQQQQFMLAIRHQGDQLAPNGAAIFSSSSFGAAPDVSAAPFRPPEPTSGATLSGEHFSGEKSPGAGEQIVAEEVQNAIASHGAQQPAAPGEPQATQTHQSSLPASSSGQTGSKRPEPSEPENEPQAAPADNKGQSDQMSESKFQRQEEQQEQRQEQRQEAQANGRERADEPPVGQASASSPSAFCADRAPGLYADESQRCKAYYQCAPTGHQMFRCNNQTQFNQKTQNCDWWYNVKCGDRLGSPADFQTQTNRESASLAQVQVSLDNEQREQQQQLDSRGQSQDREAAASSQESAHSVGAGQQQAQQQQQQQQQQQLLVLATDEQPSKGAEEQNGSQTANARWSHTNDKAAAQPAAGSSGRQQMARQQLQQQEQPNQPEAGELFHHSESLTNITVAPDAPSSLGNGNQQFQEQLQAPTGSTPSYSAARQQLEDFSERSSTTQDPLFGLGLGQAATNQQADNSETPPGTGTPINGLAPQTTSESSGASSGGDTSSSSSAAAAQGSGESRPQVGAVLGQDGVEQPGPNQSLSSQVAPGGASEQNSSTQISDGPNFSTGAPEPRSGGAESSGRQQAETSSTGGATRPRIVQSEFGLGVQHSFSSSPSSGGGQTVAAKLARSPVRFQFTRTSQLSADEQSGGWQQADELGGGGSGLSNHRYATANDKEKGAEQQRQTIYSTSANQGSVSYTPVAAHTDGATNIGASEQWHLSLSPFQPRTSATQSHLSHPGAGLPREVGVSSGGPKPSRRFGARLLTAGANSASGGKQITTTTSATSTSTNSSPITQLIR